jgi:hypothetical protein
VTAGNLIPLVALIIALGVGAQLLAEGLLVLLDERASGRQEDDLALAGLQDLGGQQGGHDRLPEPGREHDDGALPAGLLGQLDLVGAFLERLGLDHGVGDVGWGPLADAVVGFGDPLLQERVEVDLVLAHAARESAGFL